MCVPKPWSLTVLLPSPDVPVGSRGGWGRQWHPAPSSLRPITSIGSCFGHTGFKASKQTVREVEAQMAMGFSILHTQFPYCIIRAYSTYGERVYVMFWIRDVWTRSGGWWYIWEPCWQYRVQPLSLPCSLLPGKEGWEFVTVFIFTLRVKLCWQELATKV